MTPAAQKFPGKHIDEVVVFIQRRHWSTIIWKMVRWAFLIVLPIIVIVFLSVTNQSFSVGAGSPGGILATLGISVFVLVILLLFFQDVLDYYLDVLILSNERIIRIEQTGMFNRTVSQLTLDRIQDVTVQTKGISSSFLGYGTVTIETAGEQENFVLENLPNAEKIQSQILMYAKQAPRMGVERQQSPQPASPNQQTPPRRPPIVTGRP